MQLFEHEGQIHSLRQSNSCRGWHCLSSATHFGIIFSIVIVFTTLSIVWMYCMGRARIFRKEPKPHYVPRRRKSRQHHSNLKGFAQPASHAVRRIPVLKYKVAQQTPVYFVSGPQLLTAQQLGVMNAYTHLPATILRPPETQQPKRSDDRVLEDPKAQECYQEKAQPSNDESPSHHLTWWQRFYRAFNLPVGAASTVVSSPSPEPFEPPQATNINIRRSASYPSFESHAGQVDNQKAAGALGQSINEQDETSSMVCNLDTSSDSMQSIRSDVATVHSDDYEMEPR